MSKLSLKRIDASELAGGANLLQSPFWGSFKSSFEWTSHAFRIERGGRCSTLLVLVRGLGGGMSLAYVPHGPVTERQAGAGASSDNDLIWRETAEIASALRKELPAGCMFIRFDPPWGIEFPAVTKEPGGYPSDLLSPKGSFCKARMDIQPPSTVVLDIRGTEEELLKGMKSKTRYNIKLAAKKGVSVRTSGIEQLENWYEIYRVTAERDRIALHSYSYYEKLFSLAAKRRSGNPEDAPELHLLEAVIDGTVEAGIIICFQGPAGNRRATYLYGASSNNKRNYMPAYALQWEAVKLAKASGCGEYDFFGIPPADDPGHPMHGLYRFKTGFGGSILHRPGCWDYPLKPLTYKAFRAAEAFRNYYYKNLRKR